MNEPVRTDPLIIEIQNVEVNNVPIKNIVPPEFVTGLARMMRAREKRIDLHARYDERMSTLATNDGQIWYVDGAMNFQSSDHERIQQLMEMIQKVRNES